MALRLGISAARSAVARQPTVLTAATKDAWRGYAEAPGDPKKIVAVLYRRAIVTYFGGGSHGPSASPRLAAGAARPPATLGCWVRALHRLRQAAPPPSPSWQARAGCVENELGLRKFLEDRGHTYVVTDDKEGENSVLDRELVRAAAACLHVSRPANWSLQL